MAFTALDKKLIYNGINRATGVGSDRDFASKAFQFFELTAQQQESQIRQEAQIEADETAITITALQAEVARLQDEQTVLQNRANGLV